MQSPENIDEKLRRRITDSTHASVCDAPAAAALVPPAAAPPGR
jgi:hypothetical protein